MKLRNQRRSSHNTVGGRGSHLCSASVTVLTAIPSLLLLLLTTAAQACEGLDATQGWIRLPPAAATTAAAYVRLTNKSTRPLRITALSSPDFSSAMLHETRYHEGRAEMRHLDGIDLAPDASFVAQPGAAHIMLMNPRIEFREDTWVEIDFECATGDPLPVWFQVRRQAPE